MHATTCMLYMHATTTATLALRRCVCARVQGVGMVTELQKTETAVDELLDQSEIQLFRGSKAIRGTDASDDEASDDEESSEGEDNGSESGDDEDEDDEDDDEDEVRVIGTPFHA